MTKTYKTTSRSALARELLTQGFAPKTVAKRTGLSIQTIYTVKWKMANKQGLGAIKPQTPAVGKGTGITSSARAPIPLEFDLIERPAKKKSNARRNAQLKRWAREREEKKRQAIKDMYALNAYDPMEYPIPARQPKQLTMWQRIKGFFGV